MYAINSRNQYQGVPLDRGLPLGRQPLFWYRSSTVIFLRKLRSLLILFLSYSTDDKACLWPSRNDKYTAVWFPLRAVRTFDNLCGYITSEKTVCYHHSFSLQGFVFCSCSLYPSPGPHELDYGYYIFLYSTRWNWLGDLHTYVEKRSPIQE